MDVPCEIREKYLERRKKDLVVCLTALAQKNFKELERIGHQLKGNAITFGHPELSELGKKLEVSSRIRALNEIEESIQELSQWLHAH